jgi:hypothetical protein
MDVIGWFGLVFLTVITKPIGFGFGSKVENQNQRKTGPGLAITKPTNRWTITLNIPAKLHHKLKTSG